MVVVAKKPPKNAQPFDSIGQTWWLSEVDANQRRAYASLIRSNARQQLIDDKPTLSPEAFDEEWERFQARIDAGAYQWGPPIDKGGAGAGKAIRAALNSDEGAGYLVQLLLSESHGALDIKQIIDIIHGNPDGLNAALRAAQGLPPLAVAPVETPGTTETAESVTKTEAPKAEAVPTNASTS